MAIQTTNSSSLTEEINKYLDEEKYKEALLLPNNEKFAKDLRNSSWDIIPLLLKRIDNNTIMIKPSLQQCCEELLNIMVDKSNPEEVLLELIEQIEVATNDAQFIMILRPLNAILKKLTMKRGRSLEWCLNALCSYIEKIPLPENVLVEGKQRIIMDSDQSVRRIEKVYSYLPVFYQSLIDEILTNTKLINLRKLLSAFLIGCFGKPLIAVDLDYDGSTKSEARVSAETIFQDICLLEKDLFLLLKYVDYKADQESKKALLEEDTVDVYLNSDRLSLCSLGGFYYFFLCENIHIPSNIPQIYNPEYIFHKGLIPAVHLLTYPDYSIIFKGIKLINNLLSRLSPPIPHTLLDFPVHNSLCDKLVAVAVYCPAETMRKETVCLVQQYVNKFDFTGRSMLIKCLLNVANHSGMIGYTITLFKNVLAEALALNTELPSALSGVQFTNILKLICNLPYGAESDLVELADQIISALNLLRFLAIRDTENRTGFKDIYPMIETIFINPLRQGLYLSKAHYEVKLNDMNSSKKLGGEVDIELNVGGNVLNDIPIQQKKEVINSAINAFHLMESLLGHVIECTSVFKK